MIQEVEAAHKDTFAPLRKVLGWPHKITAVTPLPSDAFVIQREEFHLGHTLYGHSAIEILTNFDSCHILLFCKFRNPAPRTVLRTSGNQGKAILVNPYIRVVAPVGKGHVLTAFLLFGIFPDERHKHHLAKVWKVLPITRIPVMRVGILHSLHEQSLEVLTGVNPATASATDIAVAHETVGKPLGIFFYFSFSFHESMF